MISAMIYHLATQKGHSHGLFLTIYIGKPIVKGIILFFNLAYIIEVWEKGKCLRGIVALIFLCLIDLYFMLYTLQTFLPVDLTQNQSFCSKYLVFLLEKVFLLHLKASFWFTESKFQSNILDVIDYRYTQAIKEHSWLSSTTLWNQCIDAADI